MNFGLPDRCCKRAQLSWNDLHIEQKMQSTGKRTLSFISITFNCNMELALKIRHYSTEASGSSIEQINSNG